jgi:hypothetical protein
MAGFDLVGIQNTILTYVESEFPSYRVYEDYVLNEEELQRVDKRIKPYIVISWYGLTRLGAAGSLAGVRQDQYQSGFDIGVIAPTPKQCRYAINIIVDNLIGYAYDNVARLIPGTSTSAFVAAERDGNPHLYMAMAEFTFPVNTTDPGSYMTPPGGS